MLNLATSYFQIVLNYFFIYVLLYFFGRLFFLSINYLYKKNWEVPIYLFQTKTNIFYPIVGYYFFGNLLLLANFFSPLNSTALKIALLLPLLFNLKFLKDSPFDFRGNINFKNLLNYVFIPCVLLVSSFDIAFHYDAGFYHLNHQNWLRESTLVIGMVNIFWPYGIGSLSEYVSSMFWQETILINLHYFQIIFLSVFLNFIYYHLFEKKESNFKYPSLLLIIFALLDNFGFDGGRNGFIYIQEIGKQDLQVSILVIFVGLFCSFSIIFDKFNIYETALVLSLSLLAIQLKLSSVFLIVIISIYLLKAFNAKLLSLSKFIKINLISILFSLIWIIKNTLTSGCLFFPVERTCLNVFDWYRNGSTKFIENYTSQTSFGYQSYLLSQDLSFVDWFNDFFIYNGSFSEFYKSYYLNFIFSFLLIIILKTIFTNRNKVELKKFIYVLFFICISIFYLILFGPIPRYSTGLLTLVVALSGLNIVSLNKKFFYSFLPILFFLSLLLIPRLNSYRSALINNSIALPDPRFEWNYTEKELNDKWIAPVETDMCWINQFCTSEVGGKIIVIEGFYKTVYRDLD